jgi:uncharacterized protein (DUF1501 family)
MSTREIAMTITRRDFLRSTLVSCGGAVPLFLARSAHLLGDQPNQAGSGRVLVVIQLDGGNDGLNTVVPYQDDVYRRSRPQLAVPAGEVHRLDDRVGLHPALTNLRRLHEDGQLAIVQSVGYPNPNRSHFESMAIWQTGQLGPRAESAGWLARCLDHRFLGLGGDAPALQIGDAALPQALYGSRRHVPSLADLEQFRRRLGIADLRLAGQQRAALDDVTGRERGAPGSLLQFVQRTAATTYATSARLDAVVGARYAGANYPESGLARRLGLIAKLIQAGLGTSIYYTQLTGFDTHANQQYTHANLLSDLAGALKAFLDDLRQAREAGRVLVLVFSEFGRRLAENASGGTDHGTAAPVFLLGSAVRPGLHGSYPNLIDLVDGDPRHSVDFRRIYATILDRWLQCPSQPILGESFDHVPVLHVAK